MKTVGGVREQTNKHARTHGRTHGRPQKDTVLRRGPTWWASSTPFNITSAFRSLDCIRIRTAALIPIQYCSSICSSGRPFDLRTLSGTDFVIRPVVSSSYLCGEPSKLLSPSASVQLALPSNQILSSVMKQNRSYLGYVVRQLLNRARAQVARDPIALKSEDFFGPAGILEITSKIKIFLKIRACHTRDIYTRVQCAKFGGKKPKTVGGVRAQTNAKKHA